MTTHQKAQKEAFNEVLDLVEEWHKYDNIDLCLPVIHGELLNKLESLVKERRTVICSNCNGCGYIMDYGDKLQCQHCLPLFQTN